MSATRTKIPRMTSKNAKFKRNHAEWKAFSLILSEALDLLGYSYNAIKTRQNFMESISRTFGFIIFAGSKAEGLARLNERDTDCMLPLNFLVCTDDINDIDEAGETLVLLADKVGASPGYTKVKIAYPENIGGDLESCCFRNKAGEVQISSLLFNDIVSKQLTGSSFNGLSANGPAMTFDFRLLGFELPMDNVIAIPYKCRALVHAWRDRARCFNWPDDKTRQEVSQLDWHIVPVSSDKLGDGFQEWRICFTLGEEYLIKTFNETQLHLLVLLKHITDTVLKPICPAITSYIVKNLVLWMSEIMPPKGFKPRHLSSLLMVSLTIIRSAVDNGHLKNYMIPERNLLQDKITSDERREVKKCLESLIGKGPAFLLHQFPAIKEAMEKVYKDQGAARREQMINDNLESITMRFSSALFLSNPQQLLSDLISGIAGQIGGGRVGYMEEKFVNMFSQSMLSMMTSQSHHK